MKNPNQDPKNIQDVNGQKKQTNTVKQSTEKKPKKEFDTLNPEATSLKKPSERIDKTDPRYQPENTHYDYTNETAEMEDEDVLDELDGERNTYKPEEEDDELQ